MSKLIKYVLDNDLQNEDFSGEVLWFCEKNGNGILITSDVNHEVYFDKSVLKFDTFPKSGDILEFNFNTEIKECACAKNVRLID